MIWGFVMRFETSQHMKMGQHMKLAPRMIQSMEILQMPLSELEERIEQELESNAALEVVEATGSGDVKQAAETEQPLEVDGEGGDQEFARLDDYERANPDVVANEYAASIHRDRSLGLNSASSNNEKDAKSEAMAATPARGASLVEQLLGQWALVDVDEVLRRPGEVLISYFEDDGYLRTDLATIADRAPESDGLNEKVLGRGLQALQLFLEPSGVGARDARECLLLQLDAAESNDDTLEWARVLVRDYLEDLMQNRLPRISQDSGLTMDQIKEGIERVRKLSLAPGRMLVTEENHPITPDAIIEYNEDEDRYYAYLNDWMIPNLQVNREYALMAKNRKVETKDRDFLRKSISNASWLIDAVSQRKNTLLRVIRVVVDAQRDYFDYGPDALKPLPMTDVARELGIHVATVSRAVAEKYVLTPRGVVPLRKFFTGGTQTDEGEDVSWDAIKAGLKEIVDAEDKAKPLSDEALVKALKERGIEIARRTVAKYRAQLSIPSARLRRTY